MTCASAIHHKKSGYANKWSGDGLRWVVWGMGGYMVDMEIRSGACRGGQEACSVLSTQLAVSDQVIFQGHKLVISESRYEMKCRTSR